MVATKRKPTGKDIVLGQGSNLPKLLTSFC